MIPVTSSLQSTMPAPKATTQTVWYNIIMTDIPYWTKQFDKIRAMSKSKLENIIFNPRLTQKDKFKKIFGRKFVQAAKVYNVTLSGEQFSELLGDVFSDIGNWFSSTFSSNNLSQWEQQLRQGANISNQIANGLNYLTNMPNIQQQSQQQQQIQTVQSKVLTSGQSLLETYKLPIIGGGALLVLALLLKK